MDAYMPRLSERLQRARATARKLEASQMKICHEAALVILDLVDVLQNRAPKLYGSKNPSYKWGEETINNALKMLRNGENTRVVSETLGVPQATIQHWKNKGGR